MDPHSAYWKQEFKLPKNGFRLKGHSRSTEMTCFYLADLGIYWDAGVHSYYACDLIGLTHGHGDHFQAINGILKSQNIERSKKPIPIYCPAAIVKLVSKHIESYFQLNANNPHLKIHKIVEIIGVSAGDRLPLRIKNRNYMMDVFKCEHSVPTVGFGISEVREKLNEDLKHLPQSEIVALKKRGESITHTQEVPLICYLGDTTHDVFNQDKIFSYPTIIVECSFLLDSDTSEASKRKHMHWNHLRKVIDAHPDNLFILIHFSLRYSDYDVAKFFKDMESRPENIVVWLDRELVTGDKYKNCIMTGKDEGSSSHMPVSKSMPNLSLADCCGHDNHFQLPSVAEVDAVGADLTNAVGAELSNAVGAELSNAVESNFKTD